MKKLMLILAASSLLVGSASAEWDFDIHGAEIASPRQALTQAQHALFLAGLELELSDPVPLEPLREALNQAEEASQAAAERLVVEAATR